MTERKNNYIPAWGSLLVPSRPASEGDEVVLASIARRHVSSMSIWQADLIPPDAPSTVGEAEPPVVSLAEPPAVSLAEPPLPDLTSLREVGPKGVFYVRRAICEPQDEPARDEPVVGSKLARGRFARVLIVYLVSMALLTVSLCFMTWLDGQRNEEVAQTSVLVNGGGDSPKTEDPESETPGHRNTVIVVDR